MPESTNTPAKTPATIAELKSAFKTDAAFALDCAEKGLSLLEAKAAYSDHLAARLENRDNELAAAQAKVSELETAAASAKPTTAKPGVKPIAESQSSTIEANQFDDPRAEFDRRVDSKVKAGLVRRDAARAVINEDPELHQAVIAAANTSGPKRSQLALRMGEAA